MSCKRTGRRPPEKVKLAIDSLAFGGDAVGRDEDGRVIFVPNAAPGDRVEVEIEEEKKGYARAKLLRVLTPSPDRVSPECPHFAQGCGGCQWQHVSIDVQRRAKEEIVRRALRHVTDAIDPIATPAPAYHWRRRARLRYRRGVLGYAARRSHELIAIQVCPQLEEPLEQAVLATAVPPDGAGDVNLLVNTRGEIARDAQVIDLADDERPFLASADGFAQATAPGNALLRQLVVDGAMPLEGARVLELYAGSGNFTRDLARRAASVVAVEDSPIAAGLAKQNLAPYANVTYEARSADDPPAGEFDVLVVDPPRTGLGDAAKIAAIPAQRAVYVSCDPATLARDLGAFLKAGWRPVRVTPVDLMPQTFHVEVVTVLRR